MLDFVRFGRVGDFALGMPQSTVLEKYGVPTDWRGKPPIIGHAVPDLWKAEDWRYCNSAIGVSFNAEKLANSLFVFTENIDYDSQPFVDWPWPPAWTLTFLESWLLKNQIEYYWLEHDGWIATETGLHAHEWEENLSMTIVDNYELIPRDIAKPLTKYHPALLSKLKGFPNT